jgi:hypothetical protein
MASNDEVAPKLTLLEKLDLIPAFLSAIGNALYTALTGLFRGETGAKKYQTHITHSLSRYLTFRLSQRQKQYARVSRP